MEYDQSLNVSSLYLMYDDENTHDMAKDIHRKLSQVLPILTKLSVGADADEEKYTEFANLVESKLIPGQIVDISGIQEYYIQSKGQMPYLYDIDNTDTYQEEKDKRLSAIRDYTMWEAGSIEKSIAGMNKNLDNINDVMEEDKDKTYYTDFGDTDFPMPVTTLDETKGSGIGVHTVVTNDLTNYEPNTEMEINRINSNKSFGDRWGLSMDDWEDYYKGSLDYVAGEIKNSFGVDIDEGRVIPVDEELVRLNNSMDIYLTHSKHGQNYDNAAIINENLELYNEEHTEVSERINQLNELNSYIREQLQGS